MFYIMVVFPFSLCFNTILQADASWSIMFKALDRVDYDRLKLNSASEKSVTKTRRVKQLLDLACVALCSHTPLLEDGVRALPSHLAPKLLNSAIINIQTDAVSAIIANWPLDTLR